MTMSDNPNFTKEYIAEHSSEINPATLEPYAGESRIPVGLGTPDPRGKKPDHFGQPEKYHVQDHHLPARTTGWHSTPETTGHYAIRYKGFTDPHEELVRVNIHEDGFSVFRGRLTVDLEDIEFYRIEV